jgi:SRSO17 transposase
VSAAVLVGEEGGGVRRRLSRGQADSAFRTEPQVTEALVTTAGEAGVLFRAIVADCFYGDYAAFAELQALLDRVGAGRPLHLFLRE